MVNANDNYLCSVDPPPNGIDFYIHRSGRTGRKGQAGRSIIVLATDSEKRGSSHMFKSSGSFLRDVSLYIKFCM